MSPGEETTHRIDGFSAPSGEGRPSSGSRKWTENPRWIFRAVVGAALLLAAGGISAELWFSADRVRSAGAAIELVGRQRLLASQVLQEAHSALLGRSTGDEETVRESTAALDRFVDAYVENADVLVRGGTAPGVRMHGWLLPPIPDVPPGVGVTEGETPPLRSPGAARELWDGARGTLDSALATAEPDRLVPVPAGLTETVEGAVRTHDSLAAALRARSERVVVMGRRLPVALFALAGLFLVGGLIQLGRRLSLEGRLSRIEGQLQARSLAAAALESVQNATSFEDISSALADVLHRHTGADAAGLYRRREGERAWTPVSTAGMDLDALVECRILPRPERPVNLPPYGHEVFGCDQCPVRHDGCPAEARGIRAVAMIPGHGDDFPEELYVLMWTEGNRGSRNADVRAARMVAPHSMLAAERLRTLESITKAKREWEATFDSVPELIALTDWTHRILRVNRSFAEAVSTTCDEAVGRPLGEVVGTDVDHLPWSSPATAGDARVDASAEAELPGLDGRFIVSRSSLVGGDVEDGFVFVFRDVTLERAVEESARRAERLTALGRIVSGVSHQLNNPLASILSAADLLTEEIEGDTAEELLDTILDQARRSGRIVGTLTSFALPPETRMRPVSLPETVRGALLLREGELAALDVEVTVEAPEDLPPARGDGAQLRRAFLNLLINAEQALRQVPRERRALRVRMRSDAGAEVVVEIEDTGPGVPEERRSRIFDPFFTTKDEVGATGLGLSVCHGIIRAHGGSIGVADGPEGGARFRIRLPAAPEGAGEETPRRTDGADTAGAPPHLRVLVVDDEDSILRTVSRFLRRRGHDVEVARTVEGALEQLGRREFDVVLSDLKMPGGGGGRVYRAVLDLPESPRIVFCTGDLANPEAIELLAESGAPYLAKPFELDELATVLEAGSGALPRG